jgi:kynurenine formamidase
MRRGQLIAAAAAAVAATAVLAVRSPDAQDPSGPTSDKPLQERWAPSEWGPNDRIGSANRITPDVVMKAVKLVKQGKTATLGKLYMSDIPVFGARTWTMSFPGTPAGGPFGKNALVYHEEYVATELGQIGTQFDGPGHIGVRTSKGMFFYNGRDPQKQYQRGAGGRVMGLGDMGVEAIGEKGFVCRGIVLDAAGYKGVERLPIPNSATAPGIVTADDIRGMIRKQGIADIGEGDCVFLHTGHGNLWANSVWRTLSPEEKAKRRDEFGRGAPGFGKSACDFLATQRIALMGGDGWANDAEPWNEEGQGIYANYCHTEMQTRRGIWNLENLDLNPLLRDRAYEFLFVWAPLKIVGGSGSPGNPVAIY